MLLGRIVVLPFAVALIVLPPGLVFNCEHSNLSTLRWSWLVTVVLAERKNLRLQQPVSITQDIEDLLGVQKLVFALAQVHMWRCLHNMYLK